jgi:hypothetical protein
METSAHPCLLQVMLESPLSRLRPPDIKRAFSPLHLAPGDEGRSIGHLLAHMVNWQGQARFPPTSSLAKILDCLVHQAGCLQLRTPPDIPDPGWHGLCPSLGCLVALMVSYGHLAAGTDPAVLVGSPVIWDDPRAVIGFRVSYSQFNRHLGTFSNRKTIRAGMADARPRVFRRPSLTGPRPPTRDLGRKCDCCR